MDGGGGGGGGSFGPLALLIIANVGSYAAVVTKAL